MESVMDLRKGIDVGCVVGFGKVVGGDGASWGGWRLDGEGDWEVCGCEGRGRQEIWREMGFGGLMGVFGCWRLVEKEAARVYLLGAAKEKVDANSECTNSKRLIADFSPNEPAVESFLQVEKESGSSPLSRYAAELRLRAQQRNDSMVEISVLVGAESSVFSSKLPEMKVDEEDGGDEEEAASVFSSSWLPEKKSKVANEKPKASKKRSHQEYNVEGDEDLVEDLVLSSEEEEEEEDDDDQPNVDFCF